MTASAISFVGLWTVIIAAGVFFYVLLDGFDLGIGVLHGFAPSRDDRDAMMKSILQDRCQFAGRRSFVARRTIVGEGGVRR